MDMDKKEQEAELEVELETTGEDNGAEPELEDIESTSSNKLKDLRDKLKTCESEKRDHLEQLQRAKADFLNARKRLDEERVRDRERIIEGHVIELLPLYDSFSMAMSNQAAWEAVDKNWRVGVEGIFAQLQSLLQSYQVTTINPLGAHFDPIEHEAVGSEPVTDAAQHDTVVKVIQPGFKRTKDGTSAIIRPARVIVGHIND